MRDSTIGAVLALGDDATRSTFIGGLFTLVGLTLTLLFDKSKRSAPTPPAAPEHDDDDDETLDRLLAAMERRAVSAEARIEVLELQLQVCRDATAVMVEKYGRCRECLIAAGCDPETGQRRPQPIREDTDDPTTPAG